MYIYCTDSDKTPFLCRVRTIATSFGQNLIYQHCYLVKLLEFYTNKPNSNPVKTDGCDHLNVRMSKSFFGLNPMMFVLMFN